MDKKIIGRKIFARNCLFLLLKKFKKNLRRTVLSNIFLPLDCQEIPTHNINYLIKVLFSFLLIPYSQEIHTPYILSSNQSSFPYPYYRKESLLLAYNTSSCQEESLLLT